MEFRRGVETAIAGALRIITRVCFERYTQFIQFLDCEQAKQLSLVLEDTLWFRIVYAALLSDNDLKLNLLDVHLSLYRSITSKTPESFPDR